MSIYVNSMKFPNQVYCYEIQYGPGGQVSGIVKRGQMQHEAPVLCTDIGSVSLHLLVVGH
jgi:hypothetical protein